MLFARIIFAASLALFISVGSTAASAADLGIKAFTGHWQGNGISESEVSVAFRMTARDLDVKIETSGSGFAIVTTTVQRKKGDPSNPVAVRKSSRREFVPGNRPGLWVARDSGMASDGKASVWARIREQTLTITSIAANEEGGSNVLIYDRSLSASGMKLDFRRLVDGYVVRTVSGRLVKIQE